MWEISLIEFKSQAHYCYLKMLLQDITRKNKLLLIESKIDYSTMWFSIVSGCRCSYCSLAVLFFTAQFNLTFRF